MQKIKRILLVVVAMILVAVAPVQVVQAATPKTVISKEKYKKGLGYYDTAKYGKYYVQRDKKGLHVKKGSKGKWKTIDKKNSGYTDHKFSVSKGIILYDRMITNKSGASTTRLYSIKLNGTRKKCLKKVMGECRVAFIYKGRVYVSLMDDSKSKTKTGLYVANKYQTYLTKVASSFYYVKRYKQYVVGLNDANSASKSKVYCLNLNTKKKTTVAKSAYFPRIYNKKIYYVKHFNKKKNGEYQKQMKTCSFKGKSHKNLTNKFYADYIRYTSKSVTYVTDNGIQGPGEYRCVFKTKKITKIGEY